MQHLVAVLPITECFWCRFPEKRRKWALQARLPTNHNSKQATLGKYGICATQRQTLATMLIQTAAGTEHVSCGETKRKEIKKGK